LRASRWTWVVSLSVLVWAAAQAMPSSESFNPFGYQLLFVGGLLLGSIRELPAMLRTPAAARLAKLCLGMAVMLMGLRFWLGMKGLQEPPIMGWYRLSHLQNDGPLRVFNFALFAFVLAYWWPICVTPFRDTWFLKWISHLGRYSLSVFAWSVVATYLSIAFTPQDPSVAWMFGNLLLITSSLTIPAVLHSLLVPRREPPRMETAIL
jgi:hypothetical protein